MLVFLPPAEEMLPALEAYRRASLEAGDDLGASRCVCGKRERAVEAFLAEEVPHPHARRTFRAGPDGEDEPCRDVGPGRDEIVIGGSDQLRLGRRRSEFRGLVPLLELHRVHPHGPRRSPVVVCGKVYGHGHRHRQFHRKLDPLPFRAGPHGGAPVRDARVGRARGEVGDPCGKAEVARPVALHVHAERVFSRVRHDWLQDHAAGRLRVSVVPSALVPGEYLQRTCPVPMLRRIGGPYRQVPFLGIVFIPHVAASVQPREPPLE